MVHVIRSTWQASLTSVEVMSQSTGSLLSAEKLLIVEKHVRQVHQLLGTHCLFSAVLAALKSLKYCVIAFAASLCSLIVGPLLAGLCNTRAKSHTIAAWVAHSQTMSEPFTKYESSRI